MLKPFFSKAICVALVSVMTTSISAFQSDGNATGQGRAKSFCQTKVEFYTDFVEAFAVAQETGKPLYVLELSGNLQNEAFT